MAVPSVSIVQCGCCVIIIGSSSLIWWKLSSKVPSESSQSSFSYCTYIFRPYDLPRVLLDTSPSLTIIISNFHFSNTSSPPRILRLNWLLQIEITKGALVGSQFPIPSLPVAFPHCFLPAVPAASPFSSSPPSSDFIYYFLCSSPARLSLPPADRGLESSSMGARGCQQPPK